jgi:hypothetical protein
MYATHSFQEKWVHIKALPNRYLVHKIINNLGVKFEIGDVTLRETRSVKLARYSPRVAILCKYTLPGERNEWFLPPVDAIVVVYTGEDLLDIVGLRSNDGGCRNPRFDDECLPVLEAITL